MAKCNKVTKKVEKAGKDLQNPNSTKQVKRDASKTLNKHKNKNH